MFKPFRNVEQSENHYFEPKNSWLKITIWSLDFHGYSFFERIIRIFEAYLRRKSLDTAESQNIFIRKKYQIFQLLFDKRSLIVYRLAVKKIE